MIQTAIKRQVTLSHQKTIRRVLKDIDTKVTDIEMGNITRVIHKKITYVEVATMFFNVLGMMFSVSWVKN